MKKFMLMIICFFNVLCCGMDLKKDNGDLKTNQQNINTENQFENLPWELFNYIIIKLIKEAKTIEQINKELSSIELVNKPFRQSLLLRFAPFIINTINEEFRYNNEIKAALILSNNISLYWIRKKLDEKETTIDKLKLYIPLIFRDLPIPPEDQRIILTLLKLDLIEEQYKECLLDISVKYGYTRISNYLIKNGINPNRATPSKITLLMTAAKAGQLKTISLLKEFGANLDAQDHFGYTALMHATVNKQKAAVILLLNLGAKTLIKESSKQLTARLLAIEKGYQEIAKIINDFEIKERKAKSKIK